MFSADELLEKLKEVEALILEKTNPDGSLEFDPFPVMISLKMALLLIKSEEKSE